MAENKRSGTVVAGMALFSMFFGAGDLIWPLILGGESGDQNFFSMLGLLVTGVSLPLLGVIAMMLFEGNHREFFGRLGVKTSFVVILVLQLILGPLGSIPRLMTLSFATLKPYLFEGVDLAIFSVAASLLVLVFTLKPQRLVGLLGSVLTPLLLLTLCAIVGIGLFNAPDAKKSLLTSSEAFSQGLNVGYNTLDLIASFMFAPLVLSHFTGGSAIRSPGERGAIFIKMVKASFVAAGLLCAMYVGLTYVSSFYTPHLDPSIRPEEKLSAIARLLLGPSGAVVACIAVALVCLTTAIPLVAIFADYLKTEIFNDKVQRVPMLLVTLMLSVGISNLGFMGIATMLSPVLQILCPGLIVLSIFNTLHKLIETRVPKVPVFATFAISTLGHLSQL